MKVVYYRLLDGKVRRTSPLPDTWAVRHAIQMNRECPGTYWWLEDPEKPMLPAATEVQDDAGCFLKLARVIKRRLRRPVAKNGDTFAYSRFYGFPTGAVISEGQMTRVKQEWIKALKERGLDYKPIPLPDISFEPMIGCRVKVPMPDIN